MLITRRQALARVAVASGALFGGIGRQSVAGQSSPVAETIDYAAERSRLTATAMRGAFRREPGLQPELGYGPNRASLGLLYDYYGSLAVRDPDRFLWAGLARLAGASVLAGLDALVAADGFASPDPSPVTTALTGIAGAVFGDLAWLHEAFGENPALAAGLAAAHDLAAPARTSYEVAWTLIASPDPDAQADGNRALLANEQFSIVQPAYDLILAGSGAGPAFRATAALVPAVHPHHAAFRETVPGGDLTNAEDRWRWIAGPNGMWETWVALPEAERSRLIALPLDDLVARRW